MAVAPTSSTMSVGLWPGAPNRSNFIAQLTRYDLDSTTIYYASGATAAAWTSRSSLSTH